MHPLPPLVLEEDIRYDDTIQYTIFACAQKLTKPAQSAARNQTKNSDEETKNKKKPSYSEETDQSKPWIAGTMLFMGRMSFLPPNLQCRYTEGNTKHFANQRPGLFLSFLPPGTRDGRGVAAFTPTRRLSKRQCTASYLLKPNTGQFV